MKLEDKLNQLEEIVGKLDKGQCDLEESLSLFEKGIKISRECQKILDTAEKRVKVLVEDSENNMKEIPFDEASKEQG